MSQIKLKARRPAPGGAASSSPVGARETRQWFQLNNGRDLPSARSVGGFGGSRRFFGPSRGNPVVLAPGIGRKIAAHTGGKAASPIRGDIQGGSPLGSLLHPFLERKGCARPGMRGCHLLGGRQVAAAKSRPSRGGYRAVAQWVTWSRVTRQCRKQNRRRDLPSAGVVLVPPLVGRREFS